MSLYDSLSEDAKNLVDAFGALTSTFANAADALLNFNNTSNNTLTALDKQIAVNEKIIAGYATFIEASLVLEKRNAQINKSFGVGVKQAARLSEAFQKVATTLGVSGEQTAKYGGSIKKMLPTLNQITSVNKDFYTGLQQTQHILTTNLGLSEDQANAYSQYAMQNGENAGQMMKATQALADHLDPKGTMGYFKMITEEIAGTSEEVQLQYGKLPGNLEMAVLKAKKLGFSLEDLASTGNDLLEIESSIGQELEYQLLSGHRLVDNQGNSLTNLYREAALRGDMNQQADVLNNILESEGDVLENNLFARKQMAATLGMEEKQLASALQKKKILDKAAAAGVEINLDGTDAMANAAKALESGAISEDEFKKLKEASDTRTTDDILTEILTVMKEQTMLDILSNDQLRLIGQNQEYVTGEGADFIQNMLAGLGEDVLQTLGGAANTYAKKTAVNVIEDVYTVITTTGKQSADTDTTSGLTLDKDDAVITPGYGKRILSFPEDTLQAPIAFNDKDTIVAGTNLSGGGGGGADISQLAAAIVAAINNQTRALTSQTGGGLNASMYAS